MSHAGEPSPEDPLAALRALPRDEPCALLHTCGVGDVVESGAPAVRLFSAPVESLVVQPGDCAGAFDALDAFLGRHAERPCVGYLGYDLRDAVEALPRTIEEDLPVPVLAFAAYEREQTWPDLSVAAAAGPTGVRRARTAVGRSEYESLVAHVVEQIRAGEIFQANLTQPFTCEGVDEDPRVLFERLCAVSPAPFAAYIETGEGTAVLSSSPEELLWRDGRALRTRPIKGTRRRDADPARDAELLAELRASDKDLAELAMIVDLLRNDLGKVATTGSVAVGPFPEHASFAQVHHLFATVTAELRAGVSTVELLRAVFPGGSITGAPKLRAMEILEELELVRRGVYTGAVGWIGPGDRLHLNVAIRTMTARDGVVRLNAGGGITADSDPAAEYEETLAKAAGMLRALGARLESGE